MKVNLNFGKDHLSVNLDESWNASIIRKSAMPIEADPALAMKRALADPIGSEKLSTEAKGSRTVTILICDVTRPVPNHIILPAVISELLQAGIQKESITILIATGLHRPNEGEELRQLIGDPWILDNILIQNHYARNDADHITLGETSKGTVVKIDKRFVDADLKIVTGLVEPHFMAGYSGGRKVIAPGIAHADTITTFHNFKFMSHPNADTCVIDGNPLHEEQVEIVKMLGKVLCVNTVLDENRNLSYANFGEIIGSHMKAVEFAEKYVSVATKEKFDVVLTSGAGFPLDQTYYQTVKGMVVPMQILKDGGKLVIASQCTEGMGSEEYKNAQRQLVSLGVKNFLKNIAQKSFADIDEWQTQMQTKTMEIGSIHLYESGLNDEEKSLTGVEIIDDIELFLVGCMKQKSDGTYPTLAVIPEGPYVVPLYKD